MACRGRATLSINGTFSVQMWTEQTIRRSTLQPTETVVRLCSRWLWEAQNLKPELITFVRLTCDRSIEVFLILRISDFNRNPSPYPLDVTGSGSARQKKRLEGHFFCGSCAYFRRLPLSPIFIFLSLFRVFGYVPQEATRIRAPCRRWIRSKYFANFLFDNSDLRLWLGQSPIRPDAMPRTRVFCWHSS